MSRLRFFVPGFFVPGAFPERSFLGGGGLMGFAFNPSAYGKLVAPGEGIYSPPGIGANSFCVCLAPLCRCVSKFCR